MPIFEPLSREFLLQRGYCCYNNCKNCPYMKNNMSAEDLYIAVSRVGQLAQEAGVNFYELNTLIIAIQEKTARDAIVIGNALKTIFTRLRRDDILDRLQKHNIIVRDDAGNVLSASNILKNLNKAKQKLSDETFGVVLEQIAGVYQVVILKSLLSNLNY